MHDSKPTTSNAVWIALATLHRDDPSRKAFQVREIATKIKDLDIQNVSDATVAVHISSHCVANKPPQPDNHRKILRVRQGWYRLFVEGDPCHELRKKGRITPEPEMMPEKFGGLIKWYYEDYVKREHEEAEPMTVSRIKRYFIQYQSEEPEFASINTNNTIQIPDRIIAKLQLQSGDHIAFIPADDLVILRKAKVKLEI